MAEWLIDGAPSRGMGPRLARRAHPFQRNTRYNRDRGAESVGFHYGVSWAGRQIHSTRGIRRVPLHDRLAQAGATFAERIGWEVPMYYDPDKRAWDETPRLGWKSWSGLVEAETLAARDAAVLIDQSMYAKIQVQGPDAVRALNRVSGAEMDVPVGTSVYTQFLNARGGIEADVTVTRTAPQVFLVITGATPARSAIRPISATMPTPIGVSRFSTPPRPWHFCGSTGRRQGRSSPTCPATTLPTTPSPSVPRERSTLAMRGAGPFAGHSLANSAMNSWSLPNSQPASTMP